jgi:glucosylceramidase
MKPRSQLLGIAAVSLAFATVVRADPSADIYVTAQDTGDRLHKVATLPFAAHGSIVEATPYVYIDPSKTFQSIVGIGGALTDAAAETYAKLPAAKQTELIRAYYDSDTGIGYSLGRTNIHSCDFSSDSYTYVAEGDAELKTFSIAHDLKFRVPFIRAALAAAKGRIVMFASPWSPPAWMKENGDMLHGGKLKPEFREAWARYYVKFIQAYEAAGIPIWGLTVQNEPMAVQKWESCVFSAEDERDFVRDHLGPTLARAGLGDRKLMVWDHNRTQMYERARVILSDPAAAKYVWGVGFHWYVNDAFENVSRVKEAFPEFHLLFTEACNYPYSAAGLNDWKLGERYGRAMIEDFNRGAEGWTDWNILLDEHGGPNHVGNYCFAPVHANTATGELTFTNAFYYLGHFSKFIRPGARRIISSATTDALATTAFLNSDGSIAVVVLNTTAKVVRFTLRSATGEAATTSPAHSIVTVVVR